LPSRQLVPRNHIPVRLSALIRPSLAGFVYFVPVSTECETPQNGARPSSSFA
jgi:hypothetical protein